MAVPRSWRVAGSIALAAVMVCLALLSARHFLRGPERRFEQRELSPEVRQQLEAMTARLLAATPQELRSRIRELAGPEMPSEAEDGLAAAVRRMSEATTCELVAADGWGPTLIKAIYELTDRDGRQERIALLFERRQEGIAVLGVAQ